VGYDEKRPLGSGETGAQAALPIWMDYMQVYIDKRAIAPARRSSRRPGNIVFVTLPSGITEAFINGTQPAGMTPDPPRRSRPRPRSAQPCRRRRRRRISAVRPRLAP
jgi:penicillin-binding protein 1A